MTRSLSAGILAVALLAMAGCGSDSTTTGPDTAPPSAPQLLNGYAKEEGKVVLTWAPNVESDLDGYNIYEVGVDEPIGFAPAGSRGVAIQTTLVGETPFRITAVDRSGNESAPSSTLSVRYAAPPTAEPDNMVELRG
jgi:hypothetical protein